MANFTDVARVRAALADLSQNHANEDFDVNNTIAEVDAALAQPMDRDAQMLWIRQILRITGIGAVLGEEETAELLYRYGMRVFERDDALAPAEPEQGTGGDGQP